MDHVLDLERYPLGDLDSAAGQALVARCRDDLARTGMFNLEGFVRPEAVTKAVAELEPLRAQAFTHARRHNIYFVPEIPGLAADHPALAEFETVNHTLCADQLAGTLVTRIYEYPPLADLLSRVMGLPRLHLMADPLARLNVMRYGVGEALNWHFDRSEFTTTLLLQAPERGGRFQYARDLRSHDNPNYDGVARLISGEMAPEEVTLTAGTLNVFRGKNTAHRVTPVEGGTDRLIGVFSYYEHQGVTFSDAERIGFYGRAA